MKADLLLNWDKIDLANFLAENEADAEDLVEALHEIRKAGPMEESVLDDFIQANWKFILSCIEIEDLVEWVKEKDEEAEWEEWKDECAEQDHDYTEYMNDEYWWSFLELMFSFRVMDLAERWGHPPKWRKS